MYVIPETTEEKLKDLQTGESLTIPSYFKGITITKRAEHYVITDYNYWDGDVIPPQATSYEYNLNEIITYLVNIKL